MNGTTIRTSTGSLFAVYCSVDWLNGDDAANGNGTVKGLKPSYFRYTLNDCIASSVDYNKDLVAGEKNCKAVTYAANLTSASEQGGNFYLKDRVVVYMEGSFGSMSAGIVGG